jgi:hypothetical protein
LPTHISIAIREAEWSILREYALEISQQEFRFPFKLPNNPLNLPNRISAKCARSSIGMTYRYRIGVIDQQFDGRTILFRLVIELYKEYRLILDIGEQAVFPNQVEDPRLAQT